MIRKIFLLSRYINFRLRTADAHGIHSPFVFDLYTKAIIGKTNSDSKKNLEKLRNRMIQDKRILDVMDFGTAEQESSKRELSVSYIARHYASGNKKAELLFRLSEYFSPTTILELGTSIGIGTTALALGFPNSKIISLEGSAEISAVARENFVATGIKNVEVITGEFGSTLPLALEKFTSIDFVFIDGNHRSAPTLLYFEQCLTGTNENSVFIFDDIHWSADMEKAWKEIQKHPSVSITIDLFFVGMVFFRKGITKQNFTLKF